MRWCRKFTCPSVAVALVRLLLATFCDIAADSGLLDGALGGRLVSLAKGISVLLAGTLVSGVTTENGITSAFSPMDTCASSWVTKDQYKRKG